MTATRRTFLRGLGAAGVAGAGFAGGGAAAAAPKGKAGPASDRIRVGVIGCRGMGSSDMWSILDVDGTECAALCDVDRNVLEERAAEFEEATDSRPDTYGDYRKLLEDDEIDAVVIGTPDHWHCKMMVDACEAGKDVYVEKPMANSVEEVRIMQQAAKTYGRVVQVGQWQRSGKHWQDAMDYLWSGELGQIRTAKAWAYMSWDAPMPEPDGKPPAGVDYDMWLGPAPDRAFNPNRFHFNFRWFWDYAGGLMTDWGVHLIDMVLYGMKAVAPRSVLSAGGPFAYPDGGMETPDTQQAVYEYDGFTMLWEHAAGIDNGPYGRDHGVAFIGNNGTLVADRQGWEVIPEGEKMATIAPKPVTEPGLDRHTRNFIDCIKSREKPACPPDIAWLAAVNAHLGNVAFKTGRKVYWDQRIQSFIGDEEANALIKAHYRLPWSLPQFRNRK